jgi:hypothetical protein
MHHHSERTHAGITRDSEPVACQSGTTEGSVAMLEHEPVYWEHPRHARKRPRLMEDVGQIDAEPRSSSFCFRF